MLSIGDFARYAGLSVRMLRHYDALGLLTPSYVDPASGYRSYDQDLLVRANTRRSSPRGDRLLRGARHARWRRCRRLDGPSGPPSLLRLAIARTVRRSRRRPLGLDRLVALKELGLSLDEVGRLLDEQLDAATLQAMLVERRDALRHRIAQDRARLAEVERRLRLREGEQTMELEFVEKELPALRLTQLTGHVDDTAEIGERVGPMFEELVGKVVDGGGQPGHPGIAWYGASGEGIDLGVGFVADGDVPGTEPGTLEAVPRAVTAVYHGSMEHIGEAWQALGAYVSTQGLTLSGPCREVYLETRGEQSGWVTELQQPVT